MGDDLMDDDLMGDEVMGERGMNNYNVAPLDCFRMGNPPVIPLLTTSHPHRSSTLIPNIVAWTDNGNILMQQRKF